MKPPDWFRGFRAGLFTGLGISVLVVVGAILAMGTETSPYASADFMRKHTISDSECSARILVSFDMGAVAGARATAVLAMRQMAGGPQFTEAECVAFAKQMAEQGITR